MAKKRQIGKKVRKIERPKKLECGPDPKKSVHISHSSYNFMEKKRLDEDLGLYFEFFFFFTIFLVLVLTHESSDKFPSVY